jgi:prepilin-type processing-associated H-X9-DG protein
VGRQLRLEQQRGVDPADFGNVDFRYNGTAVCAFLDGSVRMCSVKELNDMRLWSPNAAEQDNATYRLSP